MHPKSASFARIATIARELSGRRPGGGGGGGPVISSEMAAVMKEVTCLIDLSQHPNVSRRRETGGGGKRGEGRGIA